MSVTFRPGSALRFRLAEGTFLYDCHAHEFARGDGGESFAVGFVPFFLSALFGIDPGGWQAFATAEARKLAALDPAEREAYARSLGPKRSPEDAAKLAFFAFPQAARFLKLVPGDEGPFVLRDELLFPEAPPLAALEERAPGTRDWRALTPEGALASVEGRASVRGALAGLARGERERGGLAGPAAPPPGVYLVGHSSLLIRGERTGLLIDPIMLSDLAAQPGAFSVSELGALVDAVALTHGHFDHYHLPTLLAFDGVPFIVPRVKRGSIVCEDLARRLSSFGLGDVRTPAWGSRFTVGELTVHVLPFYGEQFLTSERHADARNWGNLYVVDVAGRRVFVAADSGFEPGRSVTDLAEAWCAVNGPFDVVAAQSIALRSTFGTGDPDLQITALTCANRAAEVFLLADRAARVTLGVEDISVLCAGTGARQFVPYGQFCFARAQPGCSAGLAAELARALRDSGAPTALRALDIGQGVSLSGASEGPVTLYPGA